MSDAHDDFYVGYLPESPPALGRITKRRVGMLLALVLALSALLSAAQRPVSSAVFEFGNHRSFEGWIVEKPYPQLLVERPGDTAGVSRWLLTVYGKRGAGPAVAGLDGKRVTVDGQLIYKGERTMIEILPESIEAVEGAPAFARTAPDGWLEDLGVQTLRGEIVDLKCYLGVMKPGNLKPHRACATRCISGGVPPVLLVRDHQGHAKYLLLASEAGGTVNDAVLDRIAEPLEITGRVERMDDLFVLYADPVTYVRLD
ncbi:MAG: hypothetical protein GY711_29365 [bacterium]|nr:hypothetical protein [bacterium]